MERKLKKQKLRNNEYYDMQETFDQLYDMSTKNRTFKDLISLISSEENILLAYRNIKNNKGSKTVGTDKREISYYKDWEKEKFVSYFQSKLMNYQPKSVRRVEIPKPNGKTRPLGIPCMDDRIIQQCIKQVLEPICEAKFHKHSYGFRPNRSTEHTIARSMFLINISKLHYVVDIDIKGFFDNVNHGKLLKQMWAMGIQDKNLLCIISKILKSKVEKVGIPTKGTPQGGIISPLLSNIVLNELDWWLSDQWETFETSHKYSGHHKYAALKNRKLKEFFFVRYADDVRVFCRDYNTAKNIYLAMTKWLKERLGLEISEEKSKITNLKTSKSEFLGLELYVKPKRKKYVCQSNMCKKAKDKTVKNLKTQVKKIQKAKDKDITNEVTKLNAIILGVHNYYKIATRVSGDFANINFLVTKSLENRLRKMISHKSKKSKSYLKLYGGYNGKVREINGVTIFPIYGVRTHNALNFTQDVCNYTQRGRELCHARLNGYTHLILHLIKTYHKTQSTEYHDNMISLISGQGGKCYVTEEKLQIGAMECHHKVPKSLGGTDEYSNLVWLSYDVHKLVHSREEETIERYLAKLKLDEKGLKRINSLRKLVENSIILGTL